MSDKFHDRLRPAGAQAIYSFWANSRQGKRFPRQADLDLMSIPKLVVNCFILDYIETDRFRYRFVGTAVERHIGLALTGRTLDEMRGGKLLETLTRLFSTVHRTATPGFATTEMPTEDRKYMLYHRLALPLSDDGTHVNKLFGCHYFEVPREPATSRPYVELDDGDEVDRIDMFFDRASASP